MNFIVKGALLICFITTALGFRTFAQTSGISGTVTDDAKNPMIGAAVALLRPADSVLITGVAVDVSGRFNLEKIAVGKYLVRISFIGYLDLFRSIDLTSQPLVLNDLVLKESATKLKEVVVEGKIPPAIQKGDTTQYNASAFKTNPDANAEDLVTKMPGVTTQDGKVQAQGEDVKTVLVDGKPFFGDDPNAVLKNLPAEIIDKIQVFDKKSDQAAFTGFDDGNTSKTINIITKSQFRNGVFGKVFAGYGDDDRYKSGITLNFFKDKRRITLLALSNNINEQNFSQEDLAGVTSANNNNRPGGQRGNFGGGFRGQGGGGRQGGQGGNDVGYFLVPQSSGINQTHAIGLNYSNSWKKLDVTFSYFFNYTGNKATTDLVRQYTTSNTEGQTYTEDQTAQSNNINHRASLKLEYKMDSLHSILVQPKFTAQLNNGFTELDGQNTLPGALLSITKNKTSPDLTAMNFISPVLYRNGFKKKGRTLSVTVNPGFNRYDGENFLNSYSISYVDSLDVDSLNQYATLDKKGFNLLSNVTYTEPVIENFLATATYFTSYNNSKSDKETFDKIGISEEYDQLNPDLTNSYRYQYFAQSLGGGLRYQKDKINLTAGVAYQVATADNERTVPVKGELSKRYTSVLPNAMLMVKYSDKKNLRVNYRTSNTPPTVDQVQDVVNNTNPLQVTTGNPLLQQDYQHVLNIRYSSVNVDKNNSFFLLVNGSYTKDYIGNSVFFASDSNTVINNYHLQQGAQVTQPVNFDKAWNARSFVNYSFPVNLIKSILNLNAGISYSRNPSLISGEINYAGITAPGFGLAVSSNISTKFDFMVSSYTALTYTDNTIQSEGNSRYLNQTTRVKLNVMPWKGLVVQTDLTHQYYTGLSGDADEKYLLWNAGIGYKFLKKEAAELRLSMNDILDENKSITRNTTETYYEDVRSNVLQRYFMLTFTYNLKFYKDNTVKN